jgi:hypothetical protein
MGMGLYLWISVNEGCVNVSEKSKHDTLGPLSLVTPLNTSSNTLPPSPPPPTLLFYASLYPLCLPFLIFVSYIPEQIEGENKKREKIGEWRIREGK